MKAYSCLFVYGIVLCVISITNCTQETIEPVQWPEVRGYVEAGYVSVFSFSHPEPFDITLISKVGDADLYVSDTRQLPPPYEPDAYIFHSATCGVDKVHIHKGLKRPIYVTVYGHPYFKLSVYELNITSRASTEEDNINFELWDVNRT